MADNNDDEEQYSALKELEAELEAQAEEEAQRQAEEEERQRQIQLLKNRLNFILRHIKTTQSVTLLPTFLKDMNDAKKYDELKPLIRKIKFQLSANLVKKIWHHVIAVLAPAIPWILLVLLILILAGAAVYVISLIMPWLFPDDEGGTNSNMSSIAGITGQNFYGMRVVYEDAQTSHETMLKEYVSVVGDCVSAVDASDDKISLTIALPEEDFDYNNFAELQTSNVGLYTLIVDMLNTAYEQDVGEAPAEDVTLQDLTAGIKYFGFDETLSVSVRDKIISYLNQTDETSEGNKTFTNLTYNGELTEEKITQIQSQISTTITDFLKQDKYIFRAEKLFVKDYILSSDDATIEGVEEKQYKAMIYMPKNAVTFNDISLLVRDVDAQKFSVNYNGAPLEESVWMELEGSTTYLYSYNSTLTAAAYNHIDSNNLGFLSEGKSVLEILRSENAEKYITKQNDIYTYISDGAKFDFNYDAPFTFAEYEVDIAK